MKQTLRIMAFLSAGMTGMMVGTATVSALPAGFSSTTATAATTDATMSITGKQANNLIRWESFSIANGESVNFDGKNYLNLVNGNAKSEIFGNLSNPGGTLYLINPNGILFGSTASVNVGTLVASTRAPETVDTEAFLRGGQALPDVTSVSGNITNLGHIVASQVSLEGKSIVLKSTSNITATGGTTPLRAVTIRALGDVDIGYETDAAQAVADGVNATQYTSGYVSDAYRPATLGYTITALDGKTAQSATEYMLVHNVSELQNIQNNPSGNYMLANSIDAAGVSYHPSAMFTGTLNGLDYMIEHLTVAGTAGQDVGLVGTLSGTVRNLLLPEVSITGRGNAAVGAVAGAVAAGGTIRNVMVSGTVSADATAKASDAGGLAGTNAGTIDTVWNQATVTGGSHTSGGITGTNYHMGVVSHAVNTAAVTAEASSGVGGIVGLNRGDVNWAYNTGIATNTGYTTVDDDYTGSFAAGITGRNTFGQYDKSSDVGTVEDSVTTEYGSAAISVLEGHDTARGGATKMSSTYDESNDTFIYTTTADVKTVATTIEQTFHTKLQEAKAAQTAQQITDEAAQKAAEEAAKRAAAEAARQAILRQQLQKVDTVHDSSTQALAAVQAGVQVPKELLAAQYDRTTEERLVVPPTATQPRLALAAGSGLALVEQGSAGGTQGQMLYIVGNGSAKHAEYRTVAIRPAKASVAAEVSTGMVTEASAGTAAGSQAGAATVTTAAPVQSQVLYIVGSGSAKHAEYRTSQS